MIEMKDNFFPVVLNSLCMHVCVFTCRHTQTKPHRNMQDVHSRVLWYQGNNKNRNICFEVLS